MLSGVKLLKVQLMTEGMQVSERARAAISSGMNVPEAARGLVRDGKLTLNDYASTSGVSMELEGGIWVNAPISDFNANFVGESKQVLDFDKEFYVRSGELEIPAKPVPVAAYHDRTFEPETGKAVKWSSYAITHTDRVRISPVEGCAITCQFCDLPYDFRYRRKDVEGLVSSVAQALKDTVQPAKHVLISGGTPKEEDYEYENEVYRRVAASFPGTPVDVMMVPMPGLLDAERLKASGINGLSINLELFNGDIAKKIMHGKYKAGRQMYLDFIGNATEVFGPGKVRSLLMVGIEPLEDTLRGVEALAQRGCDPVLSPFRPDPATPMRNTLPPSIDLLCEAYARSEEIVARYPGVKLGPRCIPCMHNTLTFPDGSDAYFSS